MRLGSSALNALNPVGRVSYCASTLVCVPHSLSEEVGLALGHQAGNSASAKW